MGYLRKSDKFPVDIHVKTGIHSFKHEIQFSPPFRKKIATVMIRGIFYGNAGRIVGKRIAYVRILKTIVTVILYTGRNRNFVGQRLRPKILADIGKFFISPKAPFPVQRNESFAPFPRRVLLSAAEGNIIRTRRTKTERKSLFTQIFYHKFHPNSLLP